MEKMIASCSTRLRESEESAERRLQSERPTREIIGQVNFPRGQPNYESLMRGDLYQFALCVQARVGRPRR